MSDLRTSTQDAFRSLRQQRDELRLQIHLARAEARDEWELMEHKWHEAELKLAAMGRGTRESASEVGAALGLLADEIGNAYRRIRDAAKS